MAEPEFIEPAPELRSASYAQVVRLGNRIETSGQGGWTTSRAIPPRVVDEVAQAFDNIAGVLAPAGASWADVVSVTAYHVRSEEDVVAATAAELRRRAGHPFPAWTSVGVPMLGPGMHIEIKVTAIAGGEYELMERPEFFAAPGHGPSQPDPLHRSELVKVGNRIETAVHGGWTDRGDIPSDRDEEIAQTFANLERTLNTAGSSWSDAGSTPTTSSSTWTSSSSSAPSCGSGSPHMRRSGRVSAPPDWPIHGCGSESASPP